MELSTEIIKEAVHGRGGELHRAERLRPKGVPFIRLQEYERVGISLVVVYARVGKSIIEVLKRAINQNVSKRPRESYIILIY